jgi:hypothetical protein
LRLRLRLRLSGWRLEVTQGHPRIKYLNKDLCGLPDASGDYLFIPFLQQIAIMDNGILDKIEETPVPRSLTFHDGCAIGWEFKFGDSNGSSGLP